MRRISYNSNVLSGLLVELAIDMLAEYCLDGGRIGTHAKSAVPNLLAAMDDADIEVHAEAAMAFGTIDPPNPIFYSSVLDLLW